MLPFGQLLYRHLAAAKPPVGIREFARKTGVQPSMLSMLRKGKCPMPAARVEEWADLLDLTGDLRREFIQAAALTHIPQPEVRKQLASLAEDLRQSKRRYADLERRFQALAERSGDDG